MRVSVILGTGVAALGIGFGVYQLWPYVYKPGPEKQALSPQAQERADQLQEAIANDDPARYTTPTSDEEVTRLWEDEMSQRVLSSAQQVVTAPDLPPGSPRTFAQAAWTALEPKLIGDFDAYLASIATLGGIPPQSEEDIENLRSYFNARTSYLKYAPLNPSGAEVRRFVTDGTTRNATEDFASYATAGIRGVNSSSNSKTYPLSSAYVSRKLDAWEMIVPIRILTDEGEYGPGFISVVLSWDPLTQGWMPIQNRLYYSLHPHTGLLKKQGIPGYN
jgi:hypothetical protein